MMSHADMVKMTYVCDVFHSVMASTVCPCAMSMCQYGLIRWILVVNATFYDSNEQALPLWVKFSALKPVKPQGLDHLSSPAN